MHAVLWRSARFGWEWAWGWGCWGRLRTGGQLLGWRSLQLSCLPCLLWLLPSLCSAKQHRCMTPTCTGDTSSIKATAGIDSQLDTFTSESILPFYCWHFVPVQLSKLAWHCWYLKPRSTFANSSESAQVALQMQGCSALNSVSCALAVKQCNLNMPITAQLICNTSKRNL